MKSCPDCSKQMADAVAVCPFCGTRVDEKPPPTRTEHSVAAMRIRPAYRSARRVEAPPSLAEVAASRRATIFWTLLLLVAAGAAAAFVFLRPVRLPTEALAASTGDAVLCQGRPTCVLAYVAPRHRASRKSLQAIAELRAELAENEDVGFSVVVGADEQPALDALAREVGGEAWFDPNRRLLEATGADILPAWFVVDAEGKVKRHVKGTYFPLQQHVAKLGL